MTNEWETRGVKPPAVYVRAAASTDRETARRGAAKLKGWLERRGASASAADREVERLVNVAVHQGLREARRVGKAFVRRLREKLRAKGLYDE